MKIIIAGGGKVGENLCGQLAKEGFDIVLIEQDPATLNTLINRFDITGLIGRAENYSDLVEAGIGEADIFIGVTPEDEINLISALIARKAGAKHTIARVRKPNYNLHPEFFTKEMGISLLVNPEMAAAKEMYSSLVYPRSLRVEYFANDKVRVHELQIEENSILDGRSLYNFRNDFGDVIVCLIERNHEVYIPWGGSVLQAGDRVYVTGTKKDLHSFMEKSSYRDNKLKSLLIVGGGLASYYLLKKIKNMDIKLIERDRDKAEYLSQEFPHVQIILGDGTSQDLLKEERADKYDAFIGYTGIDEENIISSLYAKRQGVPKLITKVSSTDLLDIIGDDQLQTIITPKNLIIGDILRFIRRIHYNKTSEVELVQRIGDSMVEISQFFITDDSPIVNISLADLITKEKNLILLIIRGNELIFPSGRDKIYIGDHVLIASAHRLTAIEDILE